MMAGRLRGEKQQACISLATRKLYKKTIIVGLKSDIRSRDMLLKLLEILTEAGDNVLAIHVQQPSDTFDPNSFHMHEDICRSNQVDFLVKVCAGDSYIAELCHQVRANYATILVLGCSLPRPKESVVKACLGELPPTCTLLVMDNAGGVILQKQGTSQQGSTPLVVPSSPSSPSRKSYVNHCITAYQVQEVIKMEVHNPEITKKIGRLVLPEAKGFHRCFTLQELKLATNNFNSAMLIGVGGHSEVYQANLQDGQAAAVKVLKTTSLFSEFFQEAEILSSVKHGNIVQMIGYCGNKDMPAIVYNLLKKGSLKENLRKLEWSKRLGVAVGVAKALDYLHHSLDLPIIHRDVKSSNILLSDDYQPQLSDFGAATVHHESEQISANIKPSDVVGTFGYLAPEYVMFGNIDEKVDVYSYGVVLLELITGREAIQTNKSTCESLVLWARSLLSSGLWERLIDPHLNGDYNEKEMELMMLAARLCLIHSPFRRPTMRTILKIFEEPEKWLKRKKGREEQQSGMNFSAEENIDVCRCEARPVE